MQPGWCQPVRQEFTENECEALPGVAYPGVRDNRSTVNTKTGYDDDASYFLVKEHVILVKENSGLTLICGAIGLDVMKGGDNNGECSYALISLGPLPCCS